MKLKAIQIFNGKAEGKIIHPGDVIQSNDVERINTLVSGGYCVIVALDDVEPLPVEVVSDSYIDFRGKRYHIETIKVALGVIGVRVAHNAKEKAVNNSIASLTEEQAQALAEALDHNETTDTETD